MVVTTISFTLIKELKQAIETESNSVVEEKKYIKCKKEREKYKWLNR